MLNHANTCVVSSGGRMSPSATATSAGDPETPEHARGYASPTILVDGEDLNGIGQIDGTVGCRVYATSEGLRGVPTVEEIVAALKSPGGAIGESS
jgi:hypothetical protein